MRAKHSGGHDRGSFLRCRVWLAALLAVGIAAAGIPLAAAPAAAAGSGGTSAPDDLTVPFPATGDAIASAAATLPDPAPLAGAAPAAPATPAALLPDPAGAESWTVFSHSWPLSDGAVALELHSAPAFRPTPTGWVPIEPALRSEVGTVAVDGGLLPATFGAASSGLLTLSTPTGPVVVTAPNLSAAVPVAVNDHSVVYTDIAADTDLRYSVGRSGFKSEIVLRSADAPRSFRFHLADPVGVLGEPTRLDDGTYRFDGAVAPGVSVELPPALAYEEPAEGGDVRAPLLGTGAALSVEAAGDGFDLLFEIDPVWLAGRSFPVVLDPSITFASSAGTYVDASVQYSPRNCGGPCGVFYGDPTVGAGTYTDATYDVEPGRSLYRFSAEQIPQRSTIGRADLNLWRAGCIGVGSNYYCDEHSYRNQLHLMRAAWPTGTNFNQVSANADASPFTWIDIPAFAPNTRAWHVYDLRSAVSAWVNGTANNGVLMRMASEPYNIGGQAYASDNDTSEGHPPYVYVEYTAPPPDPIYPPGAPQNVIAVARDQALDLEWSPPASNGGAAISSYQVKAYTEAGQLVSTTSLCGSCYRTTIGGLTNGSRYYATVAATNVAGTGPAATSNVVTPQARPGIEKTVLPLRDTYARGEVLTYTVRVSHRGNVPMPLSPITDTLSDTLALPTLRAGATVVNLTSPLLGGTVPCSPSTTPVACSASSDGRTLTVSGLPTLNTGDVIDIVYPVIAVGVEGACTVATNLAQVSNAFGIADDVVSVNVCDSGLGRERWWSFVDEPTGSGGVAGVNVANGNLVVQHTDSTPIQGHGDLGFIQRRTYNSQDTTLLDLPWTIGLGWNLNVGEASDVTGAGIAARQLNVPAALETMASAFPVTMIDRDGTRHVFRPRVLDSMLDASPTSTATLLNPLGALKPRVIAPDGQNTTHVCVDTRYVAPAGVHLSVWRYVGVYSSSATDPCNTRDPGHAPVVLGYAAERVDRARYEFSATGQLLSLVDAFGNELRYTYAPAGAGELVGPLVSVHEPASCADPTVPTCRAFRFTYDPVGGEVRVGDPAGRTTVYRLSGQHLVEVVDPDGSTVSYTYHGVDGEACGGSAGQLCSITDGRDNPTRFSYQPTLLGPGRVTTVTDRRGTPTTFDYQAGYTDADRGGQRRRFAGIDSSGRVGTVAEGDTTGLYRRTSTYAWDTPTVSCRQPDAVVDNNLCSVTRASLTAQTPNGITEYLYNPEGKTIRERRQVADGTLDTIWEHKAQYVDADGTTRVFGDSAGGGGAIGSGGAPARADDDTMFVISDLVGVVPPRGNRAGSAWAEYRTTYDVADLTLFAPNDVGPDPCLNNSGAICTETKPVHDGTVRPVWFYGYDPFGQRLTALDPKNNRTTYLYYTDAELDLSNGVSAGGWLKAVIDSDLNFVAFGYDRAGNTVRTWDRNATAGLPVAAFPGTVAAPPSSKYTESLYGTGSGPLSALSAMSAPWRYVTSQRDQLGNTTTMTGDTNGNVTRVRPPRGNTGAGSAAFDTLRTYDDNDNLLTETLPASTAVPTTFVYDVHDNRIAAIDPLGVATVTVYDSVNRPIDQRFTRGPVATTTMPPSCHASTTADAPIPAGRVLCSTATAYDGHDNVIGSTDANGQTTTFRYDAVGRETSRTLPRNDGTITATRTDTLYDAEGNVTTICPPRQFTEGGSTTCTSGLGFATDRTYDRLGRLATTTTRGAPGARVTTLAYDLNSNLTGETNPRGVTTTYDYDPLNRRVARHTPRTGDTTITTRWEHDPAGNVTAELTPGLLDTGTGADGDLVVDGITHVLATGRQYRQIRLINGATLTVGAYPASEGRLDVRVATTLEVCDTCTVTVAGLGGPGGAGGTATAAATGGTGEGPGGRGGSSALLGGAGGGGAGHAANGGAGASTDIALNGGTAGNAYGTADLADHSIGARRVGSGGGGGGAGQTGLTGGAGGAGGGFVRIVADHIILAGTIDADGLGGAAIAPTTGPLAGGAGGGGSGGTVWLTANTIDLNDADAITTAGGPGGTSPSGGRGGDGASGRVRLDADTINVQGANSPAEPTHPSWGSYHRSRPGRITAYSYDAAHRPVDTVTGADSTTAALAGTPDSAGARNSRFRRLYDADGHVAAIFEPRAFAGSVTAPDAAFMQRIDYDAAGRAAATYTPRYDSSRSAFANRGGDSAQAGECPLGAEPTPVTGVPAYPATVGVCVTGHSYNNRGDLVRSTPPEATADPDRYVEHRYTDDRLLEETLAPDPSAAYPSSGTARVAVVHNTYTATSWLAHTVDPVGLEQTTEYYADGLTKKVTAEPNGALSHTRTFTYDAAGNPTGETDGRGNLSTRSYYADNRLQAQTDPEGNRTSWNYDAAGNTTNVYSPAANAFVAPNPAGLPTVNTFTLDNLLATATEPVVANGSQQRRTTFGYDGAGRNTLRGTALVDATGNVTQDAGTQQYLWSNTDRLVTETGRGSEAISHTYDAAGNPATITDHQSGSTITATHYLDGLPAGVNDGVATTRYAYTGSGDIAYRSHQLGATTTDTTYRYNDAGLPATMGDLAWGYDQAGRPVSEAAGSTHQLSAAYHPDGSLNTLTLQNPATNTTVASWGYSYDADYRQVTQSHTASAAPGGAPYAATLGYAYDRAGRLSTVTGLPGGTKTVTWDRNTNRTGYGTQQYTYRADNAIATSIEGANPAVTFTYSPSGALTNDGCSTQTYDGFDRLTQTTGSGIAGCPAAQTVTHTWDGLGRQRTRTQTNPAKTTTVHYDGLNPTALAETGTTPLSWTINPSGQPETVTEPAGTRRLIQDGTGNINLLTSNGTPTCTLRFTPFEEPINPRSGDNPCNSGSTDNTVFVGAARRDPTSGNHQFGARTYSPINATWLTPDTADPGGSLTDLSIGTDPLTANRYSYVNGDPINYIDPSGHRACDDARHCEKPRSPQGRGPSTTPVTVGGRTHYLTDTQLVRANVRLGGSSNCGISREGAVTRWYPQHGACGVMVAVHSNSIRQRVANGLGGVVEGLTAGNTKTLLGLIGAEDKVDWDSAEFEFAERATIVADLALGVGAAVKGVRALRAARAAEAGGTGLRAARQAYVEGARAIANDGGAQIAAGADASTVARGAVDARNALKATAREGIPGPVRRWAEWRNMGRYGDPIGPSYEYLVGQGKLPEQIVAGAGRTSDWINWLMGVG